MNKSFINLRKKAGKILLTGLLVTSATISANAATKNAVTTSNLNLRIGKGTNHNIIQTIKKGEKVEVLESSGSWWKIRYNNKEGYSYKKYLKNVETTSTSSEAISTKEGIVKISNGSRLNIRSGAGTNYKILGKLSNKNKVTITGSKGNWYKINYQNKEGYVHKNYINIVTSTENSNKLNKEMKVNSGNSRLNVRSGAGTNYSIKGKLTNGQIIKVLEQTSNGWYKIEFQDGIGFVSGKYLSEVPQSSNTQTSTPSTPEVSTNNAPVLTVGDYKLKINEEFSYDNLNATATDVDGDKVTITYEGDVDTQKVGNYIVKVTATDEHGEKVTKNITVRVSATNPTITAKDITVIQGSTLNSTILGATAVDCEGNNIHVDFPLNLKFDTVGEQNLTLTATDKWGLTSSINIKVTVRAEVEYGTNDPNNESFKKMVITEFYNLVNDYREKNGKDKLEISTNLENKANAWSKLMADKGNLSYIIDDKNSTNTYPDYGTSSIENISLTSWIGSDTLGEKEAIDLAKKLFNSDVAVNKETLLSDDIKSMGFGYHAKETSTGNWSIFTTKEFKS